MTPSIPLRDHEARALLAGATQLWRPVKNADYCACLTGDCPHEYQSDCDRCMEQFCPYGNPGDVVLGKEAFDWVAGSVALKRFERVIYRADGGKPPSGRWTSARNMPAWACRIKPVLASIRVRRVQEVTEADAVACGVDSISVESLPRQAAWSRRQDFAQIFDHAHGRGSFAANPWCWQLVFETPTAAQPQSE